MFNVKSKAPLAEREEEKTWPPKVTYRHPKSGQVIKQDPYVLRTVGNPNNNDRVQYLEYPAGSGNLWDAKWQAVGRWDAEKSEGQRFLRGEPHIEWKKPESSDDVLAREVATKDVKIAELQRELEAIKMEREAKKVAPKKDQGA